MNIGLLAVDSTYPNLTLMKISSYHKASGDNVEWYNPLCLYDKVYMAKVFSFTSDYRYYVHSDLIEKGGTGYDVAKALPPDIDPITHIRRKISTNEVENIIDFIEKFANHLYTKVKI